MCSFDLSKLRSLESNLPHELKPNPNQAESIVDDPSPKSLLKTRHTANGSFGRPRTDVSFT